MAHPYEFIAWDIEIAKELGDDPGNWMEHWPFGISCAMAAWRDTADGQTICYKTWQSYEEEDALDVDQCQDMVEWLGRSQTNGFKIATTNGAGFDFKVLAHESQEHDTCVKLTMNHVDFLYIMLAKKGFPVGLDAMCAGMGVEGKLHKVILKGLSPGDGHPIWELIRSDYYINTSGEVVFTGMGGAHAPAFWKLGFREPVLAYLTEDVRSQLEVAEAIQSKGAIHWKTKKGRVNNVWVPVNTVSECQSMFLPDTSWMKGGPMMTRESVLAWTQKN
jgi:hypothetical protein